MEWNDTYILLSLETAWTPLYEAYQAIAAAYHVPFVMQSIEPGERIYYNTDEAHLFSLTDIVSAYMKKAY